MNGVLASYAVLKDSGARWLGTVPESWGVMRSKRLFVPRTELARPNDVQLSATQAYGVIPQVDFERAVGRRVTKILEHLEKRRHVEVDDFVISMRSFQGGLERAWASGCIRSSYVVLRPAAPLVVGYYAYLFKSTGYIRALQSTASFIRDGQDLNFANFCEVDLPFPPLSEQSAIARFLDHADQRIRRYIRAKQKVIKLLEEQKQATLHDAVTRGLDPNVRRRHSGVGWFGDVPDHWTRYRLKALLRAIDVRSTTGTETLLSLRKEYGIVPYADHFSRPFQAKSLVGFKIVESDQLVVNRLQANNGLIFRSPIRGLVSPDYSVFACRRDLDLTYLQDLLRSQPYRAHFRRESTGLGTGTAGFLRLYDDRFLETPVFLPPMSEQESILDFTRQQLKTTHATIEKERQALTLVGEYRRRLISDVVTGKVDVREAALELPEGVERVEPLDEADVEPDVEEAEEGVETAAEEAEA